MGYFFQTAELKKSLTPLTPMEDMLPKLHMKARLNIQKPLNTNLLQLQRTNQPQPPHISQPQHLLTSQPLSDTSFFKHSLISGIGYAINGNFGIILDILNCCQSNAAFFYIIIYINYYHTLSA